MSVFDAFTAPANTQDAASTSANVAGRVGAVLRILIAGMRASKEYRHLNGMTDTQLRAIGLSRDRVGREVYSRHIAGLGGRFANPD